MFTDLRYHPELTAAVLYRKFERSSLACNQIRLKTLNAVTYRIYCYRGYFADIQISKSSGWLC